MFDGLLTFINGSPLAYLAVSVLVALDAFIPVLPGETTIIIASLLASEGSLRVVLVWLATVAGIVTGDNIAYFLGASLGRRAARRLFRSPRSRQRLAWARDQIHRRGRGLIIGGRFIPGARTALTFAAGTLDMPWRAFIAADVPGAALFATVYVTLGYTGGEFFKQNLWVALLIGLGVVGTATAGSRLYYHLQTHRDSS